MWDTGCGNKTITDNLFFGGGFHDGNTVDGNVKITLLGHRLQSEADCKLVLTCVGSGRTFKSHLSKTIYIIVGRQGGNNKPNPPLFS